MIRPGRDGDAEAVIRIVGDCWAEYPGCVMDLDGECPELRALASYCAEKGGMFWAAEQDGAVCGIVCAYPLPDGAWELGKMYVDARARGTGMAAALVDVAEGHARARGAAWMKLWSDTRFDRAHRFYEKCGYVRHGPIRALGDKSNSIEFAYAKPLSGVLVQRLDAAAAASAERALADVLLDCVAGGASVSFMASLTADEARGFWRRVAKDVALGQKILFAGWLDGRIVGTAILNLDTPPNQPHRADVAKMLVHRQARRRGIARALLARVEAEAAARGRWLLVLDTARGSLAEPLYRSAGWVEAGPIPDYAMNPDGSYCDTIVFWKRLGPAAVSAARAA